MSSNKTQSTEQRSPNETAGILPMELEQRRCEGGNGANTYSENSIADMATEPRNLNLRIENKSLVIVQHSHSKQELFNWECILHKQETKRANEGEVQADSASKVNDSLLDQHERPKELVACQFQTFGEMQHDTQTESHDTIIGSVEPPLPLIEKQGYLNGNQCESILKQLELLQDEGKFAEHERLVTACIQRFEGGKNPDMELALKMERGVACSYQKEFKVSKCMFTSVIKSEEKQNCSVTNPNILTARAYFLLVADYRSRKSVKLPPLLEFLQRSEFLLQNHDSPEDWAELYYNYGSVWLKYMSIIPDDLRNAQARKSAREKAKYYYEQAVSFCKRDQRPRVQIKKQTYFHLKLAALLLDCSSNAARTQEKEITPSDIKEAKEHLDFVQYVLGETVPVGTQVQLLKTRSDQFYRQRLYQLAKERAKEALQLATLHGFKTELETLQERIQFLDEKLDKAKVIIAEIEDESTETCYSSTE